MLQAEPLNRLKIAEALGQAGECFAVHQVEDLQRLEMANKRKCNSGTNQITSITLLHYLDKVETRLQTHSIPHSRAGSGVPGSLQSYLRQSKASVKYKI